MVLFLEDAGKSTLEEFNKKLLYVVRLSLILFRKLSKNGTVYYIVHWRYELDLFYHNSSKFILATTSRSDAKCITYEFASRKVGRETQRGGNS